VNFVPTFADGWGVRGEEGARVNDEGDSRETSAESRDDERAARCSRVPRGFDARRRDRGGGGGSRPRRWEWRAHLQLVDVDVDVDLKLRLELASAPEAGHLVELLPVRILVDNLEEVLVCDDTAGHRGRHLSLLSRDRT